MREINLPLREMLVKILLRVCVCAREYPVKAHVNTRVKSHVKDCVGNADGKRICLMCFRHKRGFPTVFGQSMLTLDCGVNSLCLLFP